MIEKPRSLSLIIPCYNEEANLPLLFKKLIEIKSKCHEIILVDNGSTDNTSKIIEKFIKNNGHRVKLLKIKTNIGYGHGIMSGVRKASGQIIAWTHADLQTDPKDVIDAYELFLSIKRDHKTVLKGVRKQRNLFDNLFTYFMSIISSIAFNVKLSDINAQPKMFKKEFFEGIYNAPNDFSLDLFFLVKAIRENYDILEFPVFFNNRKHGISKGGGSILGKIKLTIRTLSYIYKLRFNLRK